MEKRLSNDSAETDLRLDPIEAERLRKARARRYHVWVVPVIRALGMNAIVVVVLVSHYAASPAVATTTIWTFIVLVEAYCLLSWVAVAILWERLRRVFDLQHLFILLDIGWCAGATYVTGGERSSLFFLLLLRLGDQSLRFKTVLRLAHLIPLVFIAMLLYIARVDGRAIDVGPAAVKVLTLYGSGIYFALIATMADSLRTRLVSAMRLGRELIAELEQKSARLEYSMGKAKEASRLKTQFISTVSHELRTPLTAVISQAEMMIEEAEDERNVALIADVTLILTAARQLHHIVNDVLDIAKIESGTMVLLPEWFDVSLLVEETVQTIQPAAEQTGNRLIVTCGRDIGRIRGDRARARQILVNLLGNAVKFTDHGTVHLAVERHHSPDGPGAVVFRVTDTGIGMTEEVQSRLYTPFMQGDASTTRRYGGTGLGLAISKQFADMMGATLSHESVAGTGSTFTLRVPADVPAHRAPDQANATTDEAGADAHNPGR